MAPVMAGSGMQPHQGPVTVWLGEDGRVGAVAWEHPRRGWV